MAQNTEELNTEAVVAEEEVLTSYTSESAPAGDAAPNKERPALTVAGAASRYVARGRTGFDLPAG